MLTKNIPHIALEVTKTFPRIGRRIMADLFHDVNIPHSQISVVMMIYSRGASRFQDICNELKISKPTATGIISRLVKAGYVKRISDKNDRRTVTVDLTPQGQRLALKIREAAVARWTEILSRISQDDAEKYLDILKKISEVL
ncbi:MAG: winged helix-turn-helix transcriptional regulator [Candidatus Omnitrophica bacterium]|nr:winged helix-turn-helix transcriptional regulator [Candidatus Omnitrophota bacterium]